MTQQNNNVNNKQEQQRISQELESLIDELVNNLIKGKQLFKKIDELALKEGFKPKTNDNNNNNNNTNNDDNELDTIIYQKYQNALKSCNDNISNNMTFNNTGTTTKNNNILYSHFQ